MRVLMLTSRLPYPPLRGDRLRTWNTLRSVSERHEVDLITFTDDGDHDTNVAALRERADVTTVPLSRRASYINMAARLLSPAPFQASYYQSSAMRAAVQRALREREYDVVFVHLFRMAQFVLGPDGSVMKQHPGQVHVMDLTDAISAELLASLPHRPAPIRPAYAWEARKIAAYEARITRAFDESWVVSASDRDAILGLAPGAPVRVVTNGVESALFDLAPHADLKQSRAGIDSAAARTVLFVGNLSIPHNIDAVTHLARDIMPLVITRQPQARLRVVGHSLTPAVASLGDLGWVDVAGYVESLTEVYRTGEVFAAPLRYAAGVQNKVLEAMAAGIPSVVTEIVNRGIEADDGSEIIVRDAPEMVAAEIVRLLNDAGLRERIGLAGRSFVRSRYSWDALPARLEELAERG